jgi:heme-degrading monooxygenase HmoA
LPKPNHEPKSPFRSEEYLDGLGSRVDCEVWRRRLGRRPVGGDQHIGVADFRGDTVGVMAVVKIMMFDVIEGKEAELEQRFPSERAKMIRVTGLVGVELLRPVTGERRYLVYTRWDSEEAATRWLQQFLPPTADGTGLIKKVRFDNEPEPVPPLAAESVNRRRGHRLRSSLTRGVEVLEFDEV